MKRMVTALVMLGVIICTAFVTSSLVNNSINSTCAVLGKCTLKGENDDEYSLRIKEAVSLWERNKKIFYLVMFQDDFSVIEENMIKLKFLSENYDFFVILQICNETESMLRNKKEEISVNPENIF